MESPSGVDPVAEPTPVLSAEVVGVYSATAGDPGGAKYIPATTGRDSQVTSAPDVTVRDVEVIT